MNILKTFSLFLLTSSFLFGSEITDPVKEFSVHGQLLGGPRIIKYFDEIGEEYTVGTLEVEKLHDLSVYSLYNTHGTYLGKIEEQAHEKEGWFTYDRIFIVKDHHEHPLGSLMVHYTFSNLSYEFFELTGGVLFHCNQISESLQKDYFIKDKLAFSEMNTLRSRRITLLNPSLFNEQTWLSFVMIKSMLWRVTEWTRNE